MTTQLKFYKNPTEAIKILLPGSALMIIAGLITIILTVTSFINGSFSNHITQLLQVINMNDVPSFWAVAVILTFFKIASIIIEAIIAKKCFTLYQTRQKQSKKVRQSKEDWTNFKNLAIALTTLLIILIIPYLALLFIDQDPLKTFAWQGILQSLLGLVAITILTTSIRAIKCGTK